MAAFSLLLLTACIILFILYSCILFKKRPKNFPPGPPRLPLWGSYWFLLKENYTFLERSLYKLGKKYKTNVLGFFMGDIPSVVVFSNELCREVLIRDEFFGRTDTIVTRGRSYGELLGIFFVEGPYWKEQRRFSLRHLRDYGFGRRFTPTELMFEKEMRDLISLLQSEPKPEDLDICCKKGQVFMPEVLYAPILNSVLYMLIGRRFDDHKLLREIGRHVYKFLKCSDGTGNAITATPWLRYLAPDFFKYTDLMDSSNFLSSFFKVQIEEHKQNLSDNYHSDYSDVFLSKLMKLNSENQNDGSYTDKQLLWTIVDYMFPAPVATGHTVNYMFVYLVNDFGMQYRIQEEIDSVVGRSRLPSLDDRKDMPYTEAFIREILRKETLTPLGVPRKCLQDTTLGGYFIPKGTMVLSHLWGAHHDPTVYDEPQLFKPERFLDKDGNLLKKDPSIPFGAGKRLCAGETFARQTLFLVLTALMQNFTFKAVGKVPDPRNKVWGLVLSTQDFWMEAMAR